MGSLNPGGNNFGLEMFGSNTSVMAKATPGNGNIGWQHGQRETSASPQMATTSKASGGWNPGTGTPACSPTFSTGNIGHRQYGHRKLRHGNSGTSYNTGIGTGQGQHGLFQRRHRQHWHGQHGQLQQHGQLHLQLSTRQTGNTQKVPDYGQPRQLNTGVGNIGNVNTGSGARKTNQEFRCA